MPGSFNARGELDPALGHIVVCQGKKRSGKSVLALLFFESYPYDRVVIDVAGDDGPVGDDFVELRGTVDDLPRAWPEESRHEDGRRMTLRYVPDPGSPTFVEDMDAVVALALANPRGRCCLLVHEMGTLARSNRTPPHTRRSLMHNRHHGLTLIACMPRSKTVDPLVLAQADLVYTFDLPSRYDRQHTAETIGWDLVDFDAAVHRLGPNEHLRFDANWPKPKVDQAGEPIEEDYRLVHCAALPEDVVRKLLRLRPGADPDRRRQLEQLQGRA